MAEQKQNTRSMAIVELMQEEMHDTAWIKKAAQAAIELELSTIPPYLCAFWSIESRGKARTLIRSVVLAEMAHLGLMCNLLKGIGGSPQIVSAAPRYPGPLPGGVRPELTVYLSGLTRDFLHDVMMEIEKPEKPLALLSLEDTFPSIGKFYAAISDALAAEKPAISTTGQLSNFDVGVDVLATLKDATDAIERIRGEGEGTTTSAIFNGGLAHYYEFGEIYHGRELVENPPGTFTFAGNELPFPTTLPMARVPAHGWPNRDPDCKGTLKEFNDLYASLLSDLERAWSGGGDTSLDAAVATMRQMGSVARDLMKIPREACEGHYGPDFVI